MSRLGPGRAVTSGHGRGKFRRDLEDAVMTVCDNAARNQAIARNKFVAIVLGSLSVLRSTGRIASTNDVRAEKATYQSSKARDADDQEAAHPVPGHIWIANQDMTLLTPNQAATNMLLDLFSYCNHVPVLVNNADSLAESNGMRPAFAAACEYVVKFNMSGGPFRIDPSTVMSAYRDVWCPRAATAFTDAIRVLEQEHPGINTPVARFLPDGNIELSESEPDEEDRKARIKREVLQIYLAQLDHLPNRLERSWLEQLELAFRTGHCYAI